MRCTHKIDTNNQLSLTPASSIHLTGQATGTGSSVPRIRRCPTSRRIRTTISTCWRIPWWRRTLSIPSTNLLRWIPRRLRSGVYRRRHWAVRAPRMARRRTQATWSRRRIAIARRPAQLIRVLHVLGGCGAAGGSGRRALTWLRTCSCRQRGGGCVDTALDAGARGCGGGAVCGGEGLRGGRCRRRRVGGGGVGGLGRLVAGFPFAAP